MLADALARVLDAYPPATRPASPPEPLGNAGGRSGASLWRFDAAAGRLVARAWPEDGPDEAALARIHRWIGGLAHLPFVPVPVAGRDGRTFRQVPEHFDVATGDPRLCGALVEVDPGTGRATAIHRVSLDGDEVRRLMTDSSIGLRS